MITPANRRWLPNAIILVGYAATAAVATHPLWQQFATAVPSDVGDPLLNTWIIAWNGHALLTNPLGLFNANMFYPLPNALAYSEHLLSTALVALPVLLLTNQPVIAYNFAFLLSYILGAWGACLLVRRYTHNHLAAFIGGLAFAYAPYRLTAFSHLQLLTFQWLPFALLYLESMLLQPRWATFFALAALLWVQVASSWHLALFTVVILIVYIGGTWLRPASSAHLATFFGHVSLALGLVAVLTWPLACPYVALLTELRSARPLDLAAQFSAHLTDFLAAPPANRLFSEAPLLGHPFSEENYLFLGLVTPALAVIGLLTAQRFLHTRRRCPSRPVVTWATVFIVALLFTFGPFLNLDGRHIALPYAWFANLFPIFGLIRVPPRWAIAAAAALAILAGCGAAAIIKDRRISTSLLATLLALSLLAESWAVPLPLAQVGSTAKLPPVYRWLAIQPGDFGIIEWPLHVAPRPEYPEAKRLYGSTIHWKGLVNGYSGLTPTRQLTLDAKLRGFPDDQALAALRDLAAQGVRYLIVHSLEQGFDHKRWENTERWQLERSTTAFPIGELQGDYIYELNPWGDALISHPDHWPERALRCSEALWANGARLFAYGFYLDNEPPYIDLYWRTDAPIAQEASVFADLLDASGAIVAQADSIPVAGHYPMSAWVPGEIIRDRHVFASDEAHRQNSTQVRVGLYYLQSLERVPVRERPSAPITDSIILIR